MMPRWVLVCGSPGEALRSSRSAGNVKSDRAEECGDVVRVNANVRDTPCTDEPARDRSDNVKMN